MPRSLDLAAAQLGPIARDESRASVVERLIVLLREAKARGCRLVVFPEMALTTFFPRWALQDQAEIDGYFEREMPGPETQPLFDEAKRLGIAFYLGYCELTEEESRPRYFNTAILVDPEGAIVGRYRKMHLPGTEAPIAGAPFQHLEKMYFETGNLGFPVWHCLDTRVGMCICNDRRWPETYRVMALKGAELILLGFNTPALSPARPAESHLRGFHHLVTMQAGAYQNSLWVVATAKAGQEEGVDMMGLSCVIAPTGEVVAQSAGVGDELLAYSADLDMAADYRRYFAFEKNRRPEFYGPITARAGIEDSDG